MNIKRAIMLVFTARIVSWAIGCGGGHPQGSECSFDSWGGCGDDCDDGLVCDNVSDTCLPADYYDAKPAGPAQGTTCVYAPVSNCSSGELPIYCNDNLSPSFIDASCQSVSTDTNGTTFCCVALPDTSGEGGDVNDAGDDAADSATDTDDARDP